MKRILSLFSLLFLLSIPVADAGGAAPSYAELTDAPTISLGWSGGDSQSVTLRGNRTLTFSKGQQGMKYANRHTRFDNPTHCHQLADPTNFLADAGYTIRDNVHEMQLNYNDLGARATFSPSETRLVYGLLAGRK